MVISIFSCLLSPTVIFCVLNLVVGTIFITSRLKLHSGGDRHQQFSGEGTVNSPPQLVRATSFLDRVKSFDFSSFRSDQPGPLHSVAQCGDPHEQEQKVEEMTDVHDDRVARMKESESEKAVVVEEEVEERKPEEVVVVDSREAATMKQKKGRFTRSTRASFWEDEAVDEKADDFINRFRQQLKLQRMDSILRNKEMLNRGVGR